MTRRVTIFAHALLLVLLLASPALGQTVPGFVPSAAYNSGGLGNDFVAFVDLNADGIPDLVANNICAAGTYCNGGDGHWIEGAVGVLLGNGDGTFQPPVVYSSGGGDATSAAVADVNGDGIPDIVVVNSALSATVGVLLGNGDGTFQPAVTFPAGAALSSSIAIADVNGDGKPDLVLALDNCGSCNSGDGSAAVLLGNGNGTFQPPVLYDAGGPSPDSIAIADVNGDSKPDLIVANANPGNNGYGSVGILLGNGDGTFQPVRAYTSGGWYPSSVAVADVNRDGHPDILMVNSCMGSYELCPSGSVGVLLGNGDGTFKPVATYLVLAGNQSLAVGDVNGDGKPDIIVTDALPTGAPLQIDGTSLAYGPASVGVLAGLGDGTFAPAAIYAFTFTPCPDVGYSPVVRIADLNGDGQPDLLVGDGCSEDHALLNTGGSYSPTTTTLVSNANPTRFGQVVTYTATVTNQSGRALSGSVTFQSFPGPPLATIALTNGQAVCSTTFGSDDRFELKAVYKGDTYNAPSDSSPLTQMVNPASTTTTVTSSANPSTPSQAVLLTATLTSNTGAHATGTVTFTSTTSSGTVATLGTASLDGIVAVLSTTALPVGSNTITATYNGVTDFIGSSATLIETVSP